MKRLWIIFSGIYWKNLDISDYEKYAKDSLNTSTIAFDIEANNGYILNVVDNVEKSELENSIYDLMIGESSIKDCIIKNVFEDMDMIPTNVDLAAAEIELIGVERKEFILKDEIDFIKDLYDYIIIDCPPALSMLTINAMTTANSVIVPIQCEYYALEGLSQLIHTINLVSERLNPSLKIEGIVFTMYDSRTNLSNQVVENVRNNIGRNVYDSIIPRNIRLAEAPSYGMPIIQYDPKSTGAEAYMNLAEEVIKKA